ncbi:hypothetical protein BDV06DRAFT_226222 [Aspergillus oleicola]
MADHDYNDDYDFDVEHDDQQPPASNNSDSDDAIDIKISLDDSSSHKSPTAFDSEASPDADWIIQPLPAVRQSSEDRDGTFTHTLEPPQPEQTFSPPPQTLPPYPRSPSGSIDIDVDLDAADIEEIATSKSSSSRPSGFGDVPRIEVYEPRGPFRNIDQELNDIQARITRIQNRQALPENRPEDAPVQGPEEPGENVPMWHVPSNTVSVSEPNVDPEEGSNRQSYSVSGSVDYEGDDERENDFEEADDEDHEEEDVEQEEDEWENQKEDQSPLSEEALEADLAARFAEEENIEGEMQSFNDPTGNGTASGNPSTTYTPQHPWNQFADPESLELNLSPSPSTPASPLLAGPSNSVTAQVSQLDNQEQQYPASIATETPSHRSSPDELSLAVEQQAQDNIAEGKGDLMQWSEDEEEEAESSRRGASKRLPGTDYDSAGPAVDPSSQQEEGEKHEDDYEEDPDDWETDEIADENLEGENPGKELSEEEIPDQDNSEGENSGDGDSKNGRSEDNDVDGSPEDEESEEESNERPRQQERVGSFSPSPSLSIYSPGGPPVPPTQSPMDYPVRREPYNPPLNPNYPFSPNVSTIPNSSQEPEQVPVVRQEEEQELGSDLELDDWIEKELEREIGDLPEEEDPIQSELAAGLTAAGAAGLTSVIDALRDSGLDFRLASEADAGFDFALNTEVHISLPDAFNAAHNLLRSRSISSAVQESRRGPEQQPENVTEEVQDEEEPASSDVARSSRSESVSNASRKSEYRAGREPEKATENDHDQDNLVSSNVALQQQRLQEYDEHDAGGGPGQLLEQESEEQLEEQQLEQQPQVGESSTGWRGRVSSMTQAWSDSLDRTRDILRQALERIQGREDPESHQGREQSPRRPRFFEREFAPEPETPLSANIHWSRRYRIIKLVQDNDESQSEADDKAENWSEFAQNGASAASQGPESEAQPAQEQESKSDSDSDPQFGPDSGQTEDSDADPKQEDSGYLPGQAEQEQESEDQKEEERAVEEAEAEHENQKAASKAKRKQQDDPTYKPGLAEQERELEDRQEERAAQDAETEDGKQAASRASRKRDDDPEYVPGPAEQEQELEDQQEEIRAAREAEPEQEDVSESEAELEQNDDPEYVPGFAEQEQEQKDQQEEQRAAQEAVPEQEDEQEQKAAEAPEEESTEDKGKVPQTQAREKGKNKEEEEEEKKEQPLERTPSPPSTKFRKRSSSSSSPSESSKRRKTARITRSRAQKQANSSNTRLRTSNRLRSRAATRTVTTPTATPTAAETETPAAVPRNNRKRKAKSPQTAEPSTKKQKTDKEPRKNVSRLIVNNAPTKKVAVYVFGSNLQGQLGLGHNQANVTQPTLNTKLLQDKVGVVEVVAGDAHCVALTANSKILTWGENSNGQLGRETQGNDDSNEPGENETEPMEVDFSHLRLSEGTAFVQVVATESASFVLTEFGDVYGWGTFKETYTNPDGTEETIPIGFRPSIDIQGVPVHIPELSNVRRLVAGAQHVLAHTVETVRSKARDCDIDDTEPSSSKPDTRKTKGKTTKARKARTTKAKSKDSESDTSESTEEKIKSHVYAWGAHMRDQLGRKIIGRQRNNASCLIPRQCVIPSLAVGSCDIASIGAGGYHSFITKLDGSVYAWGYNRFGQTGAGKHSQVLQHDSTVQVPSCVGTLEFQSAYSITGGANTSLALTADGRCLSWGAINNDNITALGVNRANMSEDDLIYLADSDEPAILERPTLVSGIEGCIAKTSAGPSHSIAVTKRGVAYAWGSNGQFEVGSPRCECVELPSTVEGGELKGRRVVGAAAGNKFSVLLVEEQWW